MLIASQNNAGLLQKSLFYISVAGHLLTEGAAPTLIAFGVHGWTPRSSCAEEDSALAILERRLLKGPTERLEASFPGRVFLKR